MRLGTGRLACVDIDMGKNEKQKGDFRGCRRRHNKPYNRGIFI